jgi:hypothetical protein
MGDNASSERRLDYAVREIFRKRADAARKRGDRYSSSMELHSVNFDSDFDKFAANVAHGLRTKVYYRSDGGNFARGLVRASGDLELIHKAYMASSPPPPNGGQIRLRAHFFRRKDPVAENRWVMSIRFTAPDWGFFDEDVIVASPDRIRKGRASLMDDVLQCALMFADEISGTTGKRIRAMVALADRLDYPENENLWYYNRAAAREYFSWRTDNKRRQAMTQATGGKLPFDGYVYPHGNWRIYPFKTILHRHGQSSRTR